MQNVSHAPVARRRSSVTLEMLKPMFVGAFQGFGEHQIPRLSAALTFYFLLALSPMLLFLIAITGLIQSSDAFRNELLRSLGEVMGSSQAEFVRSLLHKANDSHAGILATLFGLVVALFGASGLFEQLKDSVNAVWGITRTEKGILKKILGKLSAFLMVILAGAFIVTWVAFDSWLHYVQTHYAAYSGVPIWEFVSFMATWLLLSPIFALMFKLLPSKHLEWCDVWLPAFITGLLFSIGKYVLGWYLSLSSANASYGVAGAVVIVLLWAYYCGQILLFGVELSEEYANLYGSQRGSRDRTRQSVAQGGITQPSTTA